MGLARRWLVVGTTVVAAVAACVDLTTNPSEIVAIEFQPLPSPAVVQGDVLRDSSGKPTALSAKLFDAGGNQVKDRRIDFVTPDTLVTIDLTASVAARKGVEGVARLVASGAELQSAVKLLDVVPRPDSLVSGGTIDTLRWVVPDLATTNISTDLKVRVVHRDSSVSSNSAPNALKGVKGWVVRWQLRFRNANIGATDTTSIYLVNEQGRPSYVDTTDATGAASRRVRYKPRATVPLDTAIVTVTATYKGASLPHSPQRLVLPLKPRS